jgi:murein DD-endopeptidase MepM/ murein hydrolase activator NlpD
VLAVADGVITEERDHIPENTPGRANGVPISLETLCGNYIIQRVGNGLYASYCHLQPGSLHVSRGTMVKRGQVIGLVGNSGNSSAPHLHFQLCNANSVLACEGVPYALRSFVEEHKSSDPLHAVKPQSDVVHTMEIPTMEIIVNFAK